MGLKDIIRELREDRHCSQAEIARLLGCKQQTYSGYETGNYEIPSRYIPILAEYYGVSTDYIFGLVDFKQSPSALMEPVTPGQSAGKLMGQILRLNDEGRQILSADVKLLLMKYRNK